MKIQLIDAKTESNIDTGSLSNIAFPIQKDGRKEAQRLSDTGTKYGTNAPSIIKEDNFVTAIPSSLLDDKVTIKRAIMIPCKLPARDRKRISATDIDVSPNTGSNTTVIKKAKIAGSTMCDMKYPFRPNPVTNR